MTLRLENFIYIERKPSIWRCNPVFNIWDADEVKRVWGEPKEAEYADRIGKGFHWGDKVILIPPQHTILAHTHEFIGGRENLTTMMKARSSVGRVFIEVCKCAGLGDVGYTNRWTMEITNNSRFYSIPLIVGRRIAQVCFIPTGPLVDSDYVKSGKYQTSHDLTRTIANWRASDMLPRLDKDRENPDARSSTFVPSAPISMCPHAFHDTNLCPVCCH